jgi:hypothetical protein
MTKPTAEEIVAIFDKRQHPHKHLTESESHIVIASWRAQREALIEVRRIIFDESSPTNPCIGAIGTVVCDALSAGESLPPPPKEMK